MMTQSDLLQKLSQEHVWYQQACKHIELNEHELHKVLQQA